MYLQVVKAFIILTEAYRDSTDKEGLKLELQEFVKTMTSPYKYPRKVPYCINVGVLLPVWSSTSMMALKVCRQQHVLGLVDSARSEQAWYV